MKELREQADAANSVSALQAKRKKLKMQVEIWPMPSRRSDFLQICYRNRGPSKLRLAAG
jgi:hypothetical protein